MGCGASKKPPAVSLRTAKEVLYEPCSANETPTDGSPRSVGARRDSLLRRQAMSAETTEEANSFHYKRKKIIGGCEADADLDNRSSFGVVYGRALENKPPEVIARIVEATKDNPLFSELDDERLAEIYASMLEMPCEPGMEVTHASDWPSRRIGWLGVVPAGLGSDEPDTIRLGSCSHCPLFRTAGDQAGR